MPDTQEEDRQERGAFDMFEKRMGEEGVGSAHGHMANVPWG